MPIRATAFSDPVETLYRMFGDIAGNKSLVQSLETSLESKAAKNAVEESFDAARRHADDLAAENKRVLDEGLETIFRQGDEIDDIRILAQAADDNAKRAGQLADEAFDLGKTAKQVGSTALDIGSKALDLVGFLLQLGTAVRMEFIYNELKNQDAIFRQQLDEIFARLANINQTDADQQSAINDLYRLLEMNNSQFQALMNAIAALNQYLNPIYSNSYEALYKLDSQSSALNAIKTDTSTLIQLETQTQSQLSSGFNGVRDKVCEALNSDCNPFNGYDFNSGNNSNPATNCPDVDLSGISSLLNQINGKLGQFPYSCGLGIGATSSVSEALRKLTCGFGFDDGSGNNLDEINNKLDDIRDSLTIDVAGEAVNYKISDNEEILEPLATLNYSTLATAFSTLFNRIENNQFSSFEAGLRANLYIPETWAIKIEGNRPQLIAGMRDKATAGTKDSSKWEIVIPRVRADIAGKTYHELKDYFSDYTHGQYYARVVLKDGSSFGINASSTTTAKAYLEKLMELVDPAFIPDNVEFSTGTRKNIDKNTPVTCTAIGYYSTGRKKGEKPTKRWYLPVVNET